MIDAKKLIVTATACAGLWLAVTPATAAGALIGTPRQGTYIYITHRDFPDLAANIGMSRCIDRYGSGCRVIKTYFDGCMAIAQSSDGSHHSGWAVSHSPQQANLLSIGQCAKYGNSCHLDVSVCE